MEKSEVGDEWLNEVEVYYSNHGMIVLSVFYNKGHSSSLPSTKVSKNCRFQSPSLFQTFVSFYMLYVQPEYSQSSAESSMGSPSSAESSMGSPRSPVSSIIII